MKEKESKDLIATRPYVTIREITGRDKEEEKELIKYADTIRVYCSQAPDVFMIQLRTYKPITDSFNKKAKKRLMIASESFSITELEEILAYCKAQYPKMKRVNTKPLDILVEDPSDES